jgi:hypothetical protein
MTELRERQLWAQSENGGAGRSDARLLYQRSQAVDTDNSLPCPILPTVNEAPAPLQATGDID